MEQQIRFCTAADGVRIAYATIGSGLPLVKAANWLSHLEFDWQSPVWRHWLEALAAGRRLVRYDERGCGLSDWAVEDLSFEAWVRDLEAVVDAAGLERFPLLGISQGGAVAAAYTVRHPERVSHLIMYGTFARGWSNRGRALRKEFDAQLGLIKLGWGKDNPAYRQVFTSQFMPEATLEQMRWFNDLQRVSTSPENAIRLQKESGKIDVRELLPQVTVPTVVLHCRGDARVPFEEGRLVASLIPNAHFVPLDGNNHLPQEDDPCWEPLIREVRRFLGASDSLLSTELSYVTTFMFTDIVKSTNLVEAVGDEAWEDLLRWHDQTLRSLFASHGGEEIDHAGDGFFVAFEAVPSAVQCGMAIQRALADHRRAHGFAPQVRIGLHAAKAKRAGVKYRGKGVHEAARIAALAGPGEILASQDILAASSTGLVTFDPRTVTLKGISKPIQVAKIKWS
jgi:pimeloyl-ACP methyl ester carboxylesterase/class 3 adenylate cyclase